MYTQETCGSVVPYIVYPHPMRVSSGWVWGQALYSLYGCTEYWGIVPQL